MKNSRQIYKDIAIGIVLLGVYFVAGKLGLRLAFVNASASAVWPPTGIALAALLIFGYRFWPAVFIGAFLVNFTTSGLVATSVGIAIGNSAEALLGAYLINKYALGREAFKRPQSVFKFAALAATFGPAAAATIGVTTLVLGGLASQNQFGPIWLTWWLGDASGALVIAPFFILWAQAKKFAARDSNQIIEGLVFIISLVLASQIVFGPLSVLGRENYPLAFLFFPFLMWTAIRFGRRASVAALLIFSCFAIWGTLHGFGPFFWGNQNTSLLLLQAFITTMSITTLAVAAMVFERRKLEKNLLDYTGQLAEEKATDEALLASIGEGMVATDDQGKIILANKAFEDLLGWTAAEAVGRKTNEIIVMEDENGHEIPENQRPLSLTLSTGERITATHVLVRKNKTKFPAAITATPLILQGKVAGAIKIFRDMTVEKQVDKAKSEFVSLASHQLRTPLTVVKWNVSRILESLESTEQPLEEKKKYLEKIYSTNESMIELVNAILNVSKIDLGTLAINPKPSSLSQIADDLLEELQPEIGIKNLKITKIYQKLPKV
ncbi:MAG TPA: MASE1 domain-containing protein, partial [Candidatus Limnocylindria bacterium]|nr:MASE1 domain-containing protein [Candidatus Limnocylindria bacterium]